MFPIVCSARGFLFDLHELHGFLKPLKALEEHLHLLSSVLFGHEVAQGDLNDPGQVPWRLRECLHAGLVWSLVKSVDFGWARLLGG